ncbi:MAG: periplasmic heavy metal sensor [Acidobacteriia bacterium]|nr:periplasmic heavy metal sensor [Terriglobia bacterium]
MKTIAAFALLAIFCAGAFAQPPQPPPPPPAGRGMPPGKWWNKPDMVARLKITPDQQRKMDDVFQQNRVKLIDLHGALAREEAALEPLMQAAQLDDSKILPQIDRIAQARSDLEKAEARLLLGIRHVLTPDQWRTLESEPPPDRPRPDGRPPRRE